MPKNKVVELSTLIDQKEGVVGGQPKIAGTRMPVKTIVLWHRRGLIPDEIATKYEHLSLAQIYAALAYYYANSDTINAIIAEDERFYHEITNQNQA